MTIGEKIRSLRESAGMSQTELASRIHTTKQTIYKYETGIVTNIPSDKIEQIASIFDCSPSYLMGWTDEYFEAVPDIDFSLSDFEKRIIIEYRRADEVTQLMVQRSLGLERTQKNAAESIPS